MILSLKQEGLTLTDKGLFTQELFTLDSEEVAERIQRGPLTRWEEERWNSLEETLFLKLRDMGGIQ